MLLHSLQEGVNLVLCYLSVICKAAEKYANLKNLKKYEVTAFLLFSNIYSL